MQGFQIPFSDVLYVFKVTAGGIKGQLVFLTIGLLPHVFSTLADYNLLYFNIKNQMRRV